MFLFTTSPVFELDSEKEVLPRVRPIAITTGKPVFAPAERLRWFGEAGCGRAIEALAALRCHKIVTSQR